MATKPLQSFLSVHLVNCQKIGTRVQEEGIRVSTTTIEGEIINLFHIDCDGGRRSLKMEAPNIKICDYLYYYTKKSENSEVICFLELKGNKLEKAAEQVKSTHMHLEALSKEKIPEPHSSIFTYKVCICLSGQAPSMSHSQHIHNELKQKYGRGNVEIKHGTRHDIGPLLRRM